MKSIVNVGPDAQGVPIKLWTPVDQVEASALNQLKNTARLPFVFKHVAAMPDVHFGIGATVGSVVASKGAICPAAVGVDIGCGMVAARLNIQPDQVLDKLPAIRHSIERSVPVGFNGNKTVQPDVEAWTGWANAPMAQGGGLFQKAMSQMGSLGGGNHFIELCLDEAGQVWVMLHSGSRNVGKTLAEEHIRKAKDEMKRMFIGLPDPDLAYFVEKTTAFEAYVRDVSWAQEYALWNRSVMMARVIKDLSFAVYGENFRVNALDYINCHHNYVAREHHFGENVLVTRKGAVRARRGDMGIIPGSMGTRSYIVRGLGNPESFDSCSHGAGRRMSRGQAKRTFTVDDLAAQTAGVECRKDIGVLDEIPGAYKDIDEVMANQADLVEVVAVLKQVLCIKG